MTLTPEQTADFIKLWKGGTNSKVIARKFDMSLNQLARLRQKLNLPARKGPNYTGPNREIAIRVYMSKSQHLALKQYVTKVNRPATVIIMEKIEELIKC